MTEKEKEIILSPSVSNTYKLYLLALDEQINIEEAMGLIENNIFERKDLDGAFWLSVSWPEYDNWYVELVKKTFPENSDPNDF